MKPKVLIVGTVPYNRNLTSRAFESYFSGWEHERLAQIFSNEKVPGKRTLRNAVSDNRQKDA